MEKSAILEKLTPCCNLPFSVMYWLVESTMLKNNNDTVLRNYLLNAIQQNGDMTLNGWKVYFENAVLEVGSSLSYEMLESFADGLKKPNCDELKMFINNVDIGNYIPPTIQPNIYSNNGTITDTSGKREVTQAVDVEWNLNGKNFTFKNIVNQFSNVAYNYLTLMTATGAIGYAKASDWFKSLFLSTAEAFSDSEIDILRASLMKSNESYSTSVPRIDFIAPFKLGKDIAGIQYITCIGSNLLLNLSDCQVKIINTTTNVEYNVNVINTSANTTSQFSFGYDISNLPVGEYRVYVRNGINVNLVDTTTFSVLNTLTKKDLSALIWQKGVFDGQFTQSTANGNSIYRQPQSTSGETLGSSQFSVRKLAFLSDVFLNNTEANGNWQIDFSVQYSSQFYTNYSGGSRFGIVDGTVVTSPTAGATIAYGQITDSSSVYWRMFPSNIADTGTAQTNGKYSIVKKGSIISMFQIIAGTRIKLATHTITTNFGNLRFLFGANGSAATVYDMAINVTIDAVVV